MRRISRVEEYDRLLVREIDDASIVLDVYVAYNERVLEPAAVDALWLLVW